MLNISAFFFFILLESVNIYLINIGCKESKTEQLKFTLCLLQMFSVRSWKADLPRLVLSGSEAPGSSKRFGEWLVNSGFYNLLEMTSVSIRFINILTGAQRDASNYVLLEFKSNVVKWDVILYSVHLWTSGWMFKESAKHSRAHWYSTLHYCSSRDSCKRWIMGE